MPANNVKNKENMQHPVAKNTSKQKEAIAIFLGFFKFSAKFCLEQQKWNGEKSSAIFKLVQIT